MSVMFVLFVLFVLGVFLLPSPDSIAPGLPPELPLICPWIAPGLPMNCPWIALLCPGFSLITLLNQFVWTIQIGVLLKFRHHPISMIPCQLSNISLLHTLSRYITHALSHYLLNQYTYVRWDMPGIWLVSLWGLIARRLHHCHTHANTHTI